uniref:Uncharacterized protein n=1 Tax=Arundo donax TaxID=35708 RepID=A0A0A9B296_ARUDO
MKLMTNMQAMPPLSVPLL